MCGMATVKNKINCLYSEQYLNMNYNKIQCGWHLYKILYISERNGYNNEQNITLYTYV